MSLKTRFGFRRRRIQRALEDADIFEQNGQPQLAERLRCIAREDIRVLGQLILESEDTAVPSK